MRVPDLQPIAAAIAALLLLVSVAWWLLSVPELVDPGMPSWKGSDIVSLKADVPIIADFPVFYVNDENPFVPTFARREETDKRNKLRNPSPPPTPHMIPPPRPPVVVVEPEKPKLVLPKLEPKPVNAPLVYGLVAYNGSDALIVRMPGASDSISLAPGDQVSGWTLISIDHGNFATFTDPAGLEQRYLIGQGDLVMEHDVPRANGTGKGLGPKPPTSPGIKPPGPQVDGAIPRPPPREGRPRPHKEGEMQPPPPRLPK